jgi:hypothetical protein
VGTERELRDRSLAHRFRRDARGGVSGFRERGATFNQGDQHRVKPATTRSDRLIWGLWKRGIVPKDILDLAQRGELAITVQSVCSVYNALHRERRRRGVPKHPRWGRASKKRRKKMT